MVKTEMPRCPPGPFREEGHFGRGDNFFKAMFLYLLSQYSVTSLLQILWMVSQVSGEEHSRQEWEAQEHANPRRGSTSLLLYRLAFG